MIEVELKFQLPPQVQKHLREQVDFLPSVRLISSTEQVDHYYDTTNFTCLQQAVFLRVRNQTQLEIKYHEFADPLHTHASEQVFPLLAEPTQVAALNDLCARFIPGWQNAGSVQEALARNGLVEFARISKQRRQYSYKHIFLFLDQVDALGNFLELESFCEEEQEVKHTEAELRAVLSDFFLPWLRPISIGYVELWLQRYLPQVYRLGKYQELHNPEFV